MNAVMGSCFTGANATSHAFLTFSVSVSAAVGVFRAVCLAAAICFYHVLVSSFLEIIVVAEAGRESWFTLLPEKAVEYPGGSGMPADFGFVRGVVLRSITHCGGGGGSAAIVNAMWLFDESLLV